MNFSEACSGSLFRYGGHRFTLDLIVDNQQNELAIHVNLCHL